MKQYISQEEGIGVFHVSLLHLHINTDYAMYIYEAYNVILYISLIAAGNGEILITYIYSKS